MDAVVPLSAAADVAVSGAKAANLATLMGLGVQVPDGVVVPASVFSTYAAGREPDELPDALPDELLEALYGFAGSAEPVAVRSSGIAEDLAGASYAGQYETVLNVRGRDALAAAVLHCWRSACDPRVSLYQKQQGQAAAAMAVLVQRMLRVEAAGVAFTANPVTGARDEVVISAVPAVGEQLVSGESRAEEWVVSAGAPKRLRAPVEALTPAQVLEVADVAGKIAEHFGAPQDVEWAFEDGVLHVLQARPMTALPEPVAWEAPDPNTSWVRNFRIGEWLPEPVTPLFATLVLPSMESAMAQEGQRWWGNPMTGTHALVNGWCFYAPSGGVSDLRMVAQMLLGLFRRPKTIVGLMAAMNNPDLAVRWAVDPEEKRWREERLPRYLRCIERGSSELEALGPEDLVVLASDLAGLAGEMFWSMQLVAGFGWKTEGFLAKFYAKHLRPDLGGSHQPLLRGLKAPTPPAPHAVVSLDPAIPTMGELHVPWSAPEPERLTAMERERTELEGRCRAALRPALRKRFDRMLALAQRYAVVRDEQVLDATLGWPLMRRALHRLGQHLVEAELLEDAEHVYYLGRTEIERALSGHAAPVDVSERIRTRDRQRRLAPPLRIGKPSKLLEATQSAAILAMRSHPVDGAHIVGMPASPGSAKGPVRIVRGPEEFERLRPGEILVAPTTSPAWTPLFARALAVVTDGGSVAAHASLVAREYGLPAVVAAEGATSRLRDGMIVTVDGSAGTVELPAD